MSKKVKNSLKDSTLFLKNAIAKPMEVAYFLPSSPWLIDRVAKSAHLDQAKRVMELGPGTGGTTRGILKYMAADAELISVEINEKFLKHMADTISDQRLNLSAKGAQNLSEILQDHAWEAPDVIISGIPFTTLPKGLDKAIIQSIYDVLKPEGIFLAYQFRDRVNKLARPLFGEHHFKRIEFRNLPPMTVWVWRKS